MATLDPQSLADAGHPAGMLGFDRQATEKLFDMYTVLGAEQATRQVNFYYLARPKVGMSALPGVAFVAAYAIYTLLQQAVTEVLYPVRDLNIMWPYHVVFATADAAKHEIIHISAQAGYSSAALDASSLQGELAHGDNGAFPTHTNIDISPVYTLLTIQASLVLIDLIAAHKGIYHKNHTNQTNQTDQVSDHKLHICAQKLSAALSAELAAWERRCNKPGAVAAPLTGFAEQLFDAMWGMGGQSVLVDSTGTNICAGTFTGLDILGCAYMVGNTSQKHRFVPQQGIYLRGSL